jgi:SAM-dependent methyltransferase
MGPEKNTGSRSVLAWRFPRLYDLYFRLSPVAPRLRRREIDAVFTTVGDLADPVDQVIEIGAGPGTYTRLLAPRVATVTTYDREPKMVARLMREMERNAITNVEARLGMMPDDITIDRPADGLLAAGVMDYAEDLTLWLDVFRRNVVPRGWIVCTVPVARGAPRAASPAEGWLAGRVYPRRRDELVEAITMSGLELHSLESVEYAGRAYTLVAGLRTPA